MDAERAGHVELWVVPPIVITSELVGGAVFLLIALVNLLEDDPTGWDLLVGIVAAVASGMAFGVAGSLGVQSRMVTRHMAAWHPDIPVPSSRRTIVRPGPADTP